jgi:type IV secretion system protein VirD4
VYRFCRASFIVSTLQFAGALTMGVVALGPWAWAPIVVAALVQAAKRAKTTFWAHGTARWASEDELRSMIDAKQGLILGRLRASQCRPWRNGLRALFDRRLEARQACDRLLAARLMRRSGGPVVRLSNAVHTAIFAPTGVGKGVSIAVPFLLTCPDSCVVLDLKGELARITARHRRKAFGHRTVLIDPYKVETQEPDRFDPLDFINPDSSTAIDECRDLAEALVIRTAQEKEPHWADSAELWIAAMIAATVQYAHPENRSLQRVRELLTDQAKAETAIEVMCASDGWEGMLARLGGQLKQFKDKELASTLTTANRFLRFCDSLAIRDSTMSSSFDPADLRKGKLTVYLILPPEHMRAAAGLLRMWIGSLLRACVRGGAQDTNKIHFVIDEAASLAGRMEALEDALDKFRYAGVRLQLYYQSLGQLKKCWPDGQDQTLLSNTSQIYFGINDVATAEHVSSRLGEETIVVDSGGTSRGGSSQTSRNGAEVSIGRSWNSNHNWQQHAHKLLKPDEVMALSPRTAITFTPGCRPICTRLLRYYEEKDLICTRGRRFVAAAKTLAFAVLAVVYSTATLLAVLSWSETYVQSNAGILRGAERDGREWNQELHPGSKGGVEATRNARRRRAGAGSVQRGGVHAVRAGLIQQGRPGERNDDGWSAAESR